MSLPICHPMPCVAVTHQPYSDVTSAVTSSVMAGADSGMAMSRSCDCLTQTDISAVLTPRNEQMPPDPPAAQFLQFKKVDISLETSDSEATSSGRPGAGVQQLSQHQSRLLQQSDNSGGGSGLCRSRSKSPRPQTLPGLVKASAENQAENRVTSPQVSKYLCTISAMHSSSVGLGSMGSWEPINFLTMGSGTHQDRSKTKQLLVEN